ncbi:MAG: hypothetical protein KAU44_02625, partial [Candidatus Marinimicrobia bacterium]|nr:hypothetical protein [Candidatus Neomarinimicrobiota bacterium]
VFQHDPDDPASLSNNNVEAIYESTLNGRRILWIGTRRGLNKFDPVNGEFIPFSPDSENPVSLRVIRVYSIYEPSNGNPGELWLSGGPLRIFNPVTERYDQFLHDQDDPTSIGSSGVSSVCEDKSGLMWIGSAMGINKLERHGKPFNNYFYQSGDSTSLSSNVITSIYQSSDDSLWVGTNNGLNLLHPGIGVIKQFKTRLTVNSILMDRSGMLWIGTHGNLIEYDPLTERFKDYYDGTGKPNALQARSIRQVFEDENGRFFIASGGGLYKYDRSDNLFTRYLKETVSVTSLIKSKHEKNILWLGGHTFGLVKIDIETGYFIDYMHHIRLPKSMSSSHVYSLYQTASGTIWLGTGNGLNKLVVSKEKPDSSKILEYKNYSTGEKINYRDSVGAYFDANSASMYWNSP